MTAPIIVVIVKHEVYVFEIVDHSLRLRTGRQPAEQILNRLIGLARDIQEQRQTHCHNHKGDGRLENNGGNNTAHLKTDADPPLNPHPPAFKAQKLRPEKIIRHTAPFIDLFANFRIRRVKWRILVGKNTGRPFQRTELAVKRSVRNDE